MTFKITTNSGLYIEGDVTKVDDGGVQVYVFSPAKGRSFVRNYKDKGMFEALGYCLEHEIHLLTEYQPEKDKGGLL